MEVRAQKVGLHEAGIFTEIWILSFADHGLKILLMQLADLLFRNRREAAVLPFGPLVEELLYPSDLKEKSDVRVDAFLLEKEVMGLVELLESEFLLRELAQVHDQFARNIEFDSSSQRLLVSLEDHVHEDFQLRRSFF